MSSTIFFINEEMTDADPDILLTPGTGESWWFEEIWVAGVNDDDAALEDFIVEYVSDGQDLCAFQMGEAGVEFSTTHKHFISRYQHNAGAGFILRGLPDICVPDGCRIRLVEGVGVNDFVIVHGIGALIDSTDEVSHAEKWTDADPDTILQPATDQMIRWEIMFIACNDNGLGLDLLLRKQTSAEPIIDAQFVFTGDPTNAFDYEVWKNVDGNTTIGNSVPLFIPDGYELRLQEGLNAGDFAAILFVGREYDAT